MPPIKKPFLKPIEKNQIIDLHEDKSDNNSDSVSTQSAHQASYSDTENEDSSEHNDWLNDEDDGTFDEEENLLLGIHEVIEDKSKEEKEKSVLVKDMTLQQKKKIIMESFEMARKKLPWKKAIDSKSKSGSDELFTEKGTIPSKPNVDPEETINLLPKIEKLVFVGKSTSHGFLENFLNIISQRKHFSHLFETVQRYMSLDMNMIKETCREYPEVVNKSVWLTYHRDPKHFMMLFECLTQYNFRKKYLNRSVKKDFDTDMIVLKQNTIHALVFFNAKNNTSYTTFTANDKVYAGEFFDCAVNLFGNKNELKDELDKRQLDSYDTFEFKLGQLSAEHVAVKMEEVAGDGTSTAPLELE